MKYIVWGAGQRGKKALDILGKDKIHCFVDKNSEYIGQSVNGIEIKSPSYVEQVYSSKEYILLITPAEFEGQIINELNKKGIYIYLMFSDHPIGIDLSEESESISYILNKPRQYENIILHGINWFNIFLYDYYIDLGLNVALYKDVDDNENVYEILKKEYIFFSEKKSYDVEWCFFHKYASNGLMNMRNVDIEEYIESAYPIFNSKLLDFKNIHEGDICCIVATGPSLTLSDVNMLKDNNITCISMNRIYNLFNQTSWRPDYYVVEDQKMIEDLAEEIANIDLKYKFINGDVNKYWEIKKSYSSISYKMVMQDCLSDRVGFSRNIDRFMYNGYTVTYVCIQLALYMGFKEIFLLGVDFNYSDDVYAESNHFEGYQKHYKDIRLNEIKPERMLNAYRKAKKIAEAEGKNIYNATRGGKLEVFERRTLDSIDRR